MKVTTWPEGADDTETVRVVADGGGIEIQIAELRDGSLNVVFGGTGVVEPVQVDRRGYTYVRVWPAERDA